jgi:hypothetical protein
MLLCFVYTCSEPRPPVFCSLGKVPTESGSTCPDLIRKIPILSERVASDPRLLVALQFTPPIFLLTDPLSALCLRVTVAAHICYSGRPKMNLNPPLVPKIATRKRKPTP